jgi:ABC-type antimicrobial peptide transport system permease subunit
VTIGDSAHLALRNLNQAKLRTALTVLGVSIGIASLAGMVSLGLGLQEQFVGRFTKSGMFDAITVMSPGDRPGVLAGGLRGRGAGARGSATPEKPRPPLDDDALKKIGALQRVKEVYPNLRVPVELKYEQFSEQITAMGVAMSARNEGAFQTFAYGGFFTSESDNACLLSLDLAKRVDERDPKNLLGKQVTLTWASPSTFAAGAPSMPDNPLQIQRGDARYTVVGIVEREPGPGGLPGAILSGLMIPLGKARDMGAVDVGSLQAFFRRPTQAKSYASATVKVTQAQFTEDVENQIKDMGFMAFSLNDALKGAKRAFIILDIVLSLIGSIALAVSSLGIVNTMVMSILERTREIGIMKAIGGSDGDIRRIFLVEASAIGCMGGVAGVALGWLVGRAINFGANVYIRSQGGPTGDLFSLPLWLIAGAIGFAFVVSLIAGSYPASRAARLDPIRALRHD